MTKCQPKWKGMLWVRFDLSFSVMFSFLSQLLALIISVGVHALHTCKSFTLIHILYLPFTEAYCQIIPELKKKQLILTSSVLQFLFSLDKEAKSLVFFDIHFFDIQITFFDHNIKKKVSLELDIS